MGSNVVLVSLSLSFALSKFIALQNHKLPNSTLKRKTQEVAVTKSESKRKREGKRSAIFKVIRLLLQLVQEIQNSVRSSQIHIRCSVEV